MSKGRNVDRFTVFYQQSPDRKNMFVWCRQIIAHPLFPRLNDFSYSLEAHTCIYVYLFQAFRKTQLVEIFSWTVAKWFFTISFRKIYFLDVYFVLPPRSSRVFHALAFPKPFPVRKVMFIYQMRNYYMSGMFSNLINFRAENFQHNRIWHVTHSLKRQIGDLNSVLFFQASHSPSKENSRILALASHSR